MSQSNGVDTIKRMEFEFKGKEYYFVLNPEEYSQTEASRSTVTQTLGGAWIDAFGAGLVEITFSGTTGFKNGTDNPADGFEKFKELRDTLRSVYNDVKAGEVVTETLKFYNFTDEEYWEVYPDRFSLKRSKTRSLLYMYDIRLIALKKLSEGKQAGGRIGNPFPVVDTTIAATDGIDENSNQVVPVGTQQGGSNVSLFPQVRNAVTLGLIATVGNALKSAVNTTTTDILNLSTIASVVSNNIAELVGATDGKFSPAVTKKLVLDTNILDTGNIANIQDSNTVISGTDALNFRPQVSRATHTLFKDLRKFNTEYMEIDKFTPLIAEYLGTSKSKNSTIPQSSMVSLIANQDDKAVDSSILKSLQEESTKMQATDVKRVKALIIDGMGIYKDLYGFVMGTKQMLEFTEEDVTRLSTNIRFMTTKLESLDSVPYMTIRELRKLETNLSAIQAQSRLFDSSSIDRVTTLRQSQGDE